MKPTLMTSALALSLIGLGVSISLAQGDSESQHGTPHPSFEALDINGDAALSMDEISSSDGDHHLAQADSNSDGVISPEEWQAAQDTRSDKRHGNDHGDDSNHGDRSGHGDDSNHGDRNDHGDGSNHSNDHGNN